MKRRKERKRRFVDRHMTREGDGGGDVRGWRCLDCKRLCITALGLCSVSYDDDDDDGDDDGVDNDDGDDDDNDGNGKGGDEV